MNEPLLFHRAYHDQRLREVNNSDQGTVRDRDVNVTLAKNRVNPIQRKTHRREMQEKRARETQCHLGTKRPATYTARTTTDDNKLLARRRKARKKMSRAAAFTSSLKMYIRAPNLRRNK